ncbi:MULTISPECIES: hypothetical protein [Methylobacterium]|nr:MULTISPECIES: hypothetical protein [Methylobacterium]
MMGVITLIRTSLWRETAKSAVAAAVEMLDAATDIQGRPIAASRP